MNAMFPRLVAQRALGFQWSVGMLEGDYLYVPGLAEFILLKVPAGPQRPKGQINVEKERT